MAIYKIGRAEGNNVVLGDKSVSRQHAELEELGAGRFRLKDLGSSSGTHMLSGSEWIEVQESEVRHDTRIRFGEYETTPADLLRDQDKTVVQARPSAAPEAPPSAPPAAAPPSPPRPAPPKPAAPKPAAPKPAAPKPAAPRPAAPRPAPAPAGARPGGGGIDKKTMWIIIGGGGGLLLLALIAVVVVLVAGDSQQTADVRPPPARTETPAPPAQPAQPPAQPAQPPAQPAQPPAQPPATGTGLQKFTQACRATWGGSETACACFVRAVQPILREGDFDVAIELIGIAVRGNREELTRRAQQLAQDRGAAMVQRVDEAMKAIGRDCRDVR